MNNRSNTYQMFIPLKGIAIYKQIAIILVIFMSRLVAPSFAGGEVVPPYILK